MSILEWDQRFELGVKHFDEQHQQLVALLNDLHDKINDSAVTNEALDAVIVKLVDYATDHFAGEENSMAYHEFPGLACHRGEHLKFCRMVATFQDDFQDGKNDFALDILSFLGNWLFDHILITDSEYCKFLEQLKKSV